MAKKTGQLHARDHLAGGIDPIIGLLPAAGGDYHSLILAEPSLVAYWPLDEPTGWDALDHSGNGHHFSNPTGFVGPPGQGAPGPFPSVAALTSYTFDPALEDGDGARLEQDNPELNEDTGAVTFECWLYPTAAADHMVVAEFRSPTADVAFQAQVRSGHNMIWAAGPTGSVDSVALVNFDEWTHFVGVSSATETTKMYWDGALIAEGGVVGYTIAGANFRLGAGLFASDWMPFEGRLAQVAIYNAVLTPDRITAHYQTGVSTTSTEEGYALVIDEDGNPVFRPPGVEVTHGDGPPAEAPATSPPSLSGPTNGSGWHLDNHVETAVLYDSSPARFDVPSRTWVRVPFNTARIQRSWETSVNGPVKSAWLEDDRGLTAQAANGLLHITADMTSPQTVTGWWTIEYPVLDYSRLPDGGIPAYADSYARAARLVNASTGTVLRVTPGDPYRRFFEWLFPAQADEVLSSVDYPVDNPYPIYPVWAGRPLVKPAPYPQFDEPSSLLYYLTVAGNPGFGPEFLLVETDLGDGDNLCLQAWQDSPWTIRFSTDHFPNHRPAANAQAWRQRPYLSVAYKYDPDSIDHTTGALL